MWPFVGWSSYLYSFCSFLCWPFCLVSTLLTFILMSRKVNYIFRHHFDTVILTLQKNQTKSKHSNAFQKILKLVKILLSLLIFRQCNPKICWSRLAGRPTLHQAHLGRPLESPGTTAYSCPCTGKAASLLGSLNLHMQFRGHRSEEAAQPKLGLMVWEWGLGCSPVTGEGPQ